jgi:hypothetical protein
MPQSHVRIDCEKANPLPISELPESSHPADQYLRQTRDLRFQESRQYAPKRDSHEITLQALLPLPHWASSTARRIADLPQTRNSILRAGRIAPRLTPPATSQINSNYEASLADQRGSPPPRACRHCLHASRPGGPFTECIVLEGFFEGACTNYKVNNTASRYSLYSRTRYSSKLVGSFCLPVQQLLRMQVVERQPAYQSQLFHQGTSSTWISKHSEREGKT